MGNLSPTIGVLVAAGALCAASTTEDAAAGHAAAPRPPPHIIFFLQDDLGWHDSGVHNPEMLPVSRNIAALAADGVVLTNHLVHYHCSPSRRAFLSGRLPFHHNEGLSGVATDDMDLRWTLVSGKLRQAGFKTHWVGKGHVGFMSMNHLPTRRGFDTFHGFLAGDQSYTSTDRWAGEAPWHNDTYSTDLFGSIAVDIVDQHDPTAPLFLYLPWQAVHSPYDPVPGFNCSTTAFEPPYKGVYAGMLHESDVWTGRIVEQLKQKGMWNNTLLVFSSDNGGVSENRLQGINFPLRGEKHGNWAGGYRATAFVSGGCVPPRLRGTRSNLRMSIVDW